jgi:hypothetical protein
MTSTRWTQWPTLMVDRCSHASLGSRICFSTSPWLLDDGTYVWQVGGRDWHIGMVAYTTAERFRGQTEFEPLLRDIDEAARTLSLARRWSIVEALVNAATAAAARTKLRGLTADA